MFQDVITSGTTRWVHWRAGPGSRLEKFLETVTKTERTTLFARMREVACHGIREAVESTGTFVDRVTAEVPANDVELLLLRGHMSQIVFVADGDIAVVVDGGPLGPMSTGAVASAQNEARRLLGQLAAGQERKGQG